MENDLHNTSFNSGAYNDITEHLRAAVQDVLSRRGGVLVKRKMKFDLITAILAILLSFTIGVIIGAVLFAFVLINIAAVMVFAVVLILLLVFRHIVLRNASSCDCKC